MSNLFVKENYIVKKENVIDLFENVVCQNPNKIAMIFEDKKITYREIERNIHRIRSAYQFTPGMVVGILLDRGVSLLSSVLAVMRDRAIYMPIYNGLPKSRIQAMLEQSKCRVIILQKKYKHIIDEIMTDNQSSFVFIFVDDLMRIQVDLQNNTDLAGSSSLTNYVSGEEDVAYIMFTSGTTGRPKGIMVNHKNMINMLNSFRKIVTVKQTDIIVGLTKVCFDISILELFLPLVTGATVLLLSDEQAEQPKLLLQVIKEHKATVLQLTPSKLKQIIFINHAYKYLNTIQKVLIGGEPLDSICSDYILHNLDCDLWNVYGPTETTVWSTYKKITDKNITLGKPIDRTSIVILDNEHHVLENGNMGEIAIGGEGVSYGYLNNPELTREKFIKLENVNDTLFYKTGDIGKINKNGELIFMGRNDSQVKIRGNRIEIDEIKQDIINSQMVEDVHVYCENGELVAVVILKKNHDILQLQEWNKKYLPEYMIPSKYYNVDHFPLNNSGKLDSKELKTLVKKKLLEQESKQCELEELSFTEVKIKLIWDEILGESNFSKYDSFIELGGNSVDYVFMLSMILQELDVDVESINMKNALTISLLAKEVEKWVS